METTRPLTAPVAFRAILDRLGHAVRPSGPWLHVGESRDPAGWKLHLSAISVDARELLRRALPLLVEATVPFKIARDDETLERLNEGELGATQVGKFVTIYPPSHAASRRLAERLVSVTAGLRGPTIPTDLRLGDVVYTRFGSYNPVVGRDRLGQFSLSIPRADGTLAPDVPPVPFVAPDGVENPFADWPRREPESHGHLFGPGYLIVDVLKAHPKGAVFRAIDLRSQEQTALKVLKQGRAHCLSDSLGRDMRDRLRHQASLLARVRGIVPAPAADAYFEVNGDGYLPVDLVDGPSLETEVYATLNGGRWRSTPLPGRRRLLAAIHQLASQLSSLHRAGILHRDVTGSNALLDEGGRLTLIDFELAHALDADEPPFGVGSSRVDLQACKLEYSIVSPK